MRTAILLLTLSCAGCASVGDGFTGRQEIAVTVKPANAVCDVKRTDGWSYGQHKGPQFTLDVRKNGKALEIACQARRYQPKTVVANSSVNGLVAVTTLGSASALAFSSTNGNFWRYPTEISIELER